MKITVYELLRLVKEDKAPKKIKYKNKIYFRTWGDYMGDEPICGYYFDSEENGWDDEACIKLDDEVEIIEEEKEIEKLNLDTDELRGKEIVRSIDYLLEGKINELIDIINDMRDKE